MMKITDLSHCERENLHNQWLTKYSLAPLYMSPINKKQAYCMHNLGWQQI